MIRTCEQNEYKDYELGRRRFADSLLIVYQAQHSMSKALLETIKQKNKYHLANSLLRYRWLHEPDTEVKLSSDYFALSNSVIADDDKAYLVGDEFDGFTNEIMNMMVSDIINKNPIEKLIDSSGSLMGLLEYVRKYDKTLPAHQLENIDSLKRFIPYSAKLMGKQNFNFNITDTVEKSKTIQRFKKLLQYLNESNFDGYYIKNLELSYRLTQIDSLFSKGIFRDYLLGHYLYKHFLERKRLILEDEMLRKIKTIFSNSAFYLAVEEENWRLKSVL